MTFGKCDRQLRKTTRVSLDHVERKIEKFKIQVELNLATAVKDKWL